MQYVRIIKVDGSEVLYKKMNICIDFNKQQIKIWNGAFWEETPFNNYKIIASFDVDEDYQDEYEKIKKQALQ